MPGEESVAVRRNAHVPRPRNPALALPFDVPPGEESGAPEGMEPAWQQEGNQSLAARRASKQQATVPPWANAYPSGPAEPVDSNLAMTSTTRVCPGAPGGVIAVTRDERTPAEKARRRAELMRELEELSEAEA